MPNFNDPNFIREQQDMHAHYGDSDVLWEEWRDNCMEHYPAALAEITRLQKENAELREQLEPPTGEELLAWQEQQAHDTIAQEAYDAGYLKAEGEFRTAL